MTKRRHCAVRGHIYGAVPMFDSTSALSVILYIEANITVRRINNQLTMIIHPPDFHIQLISTGNFLIWSELDAVNRAGELLPGKNQPIQ